MKKKLLFFIVLFTIVLAGCSSTSSAFCAFIVGDGTFDRDVHNVLYPGENLEKLGANENIVYVPCNSRNYIFNDGTRTNANGEIVGDTHTLIKANTSTGTPILIGVTAYWTLNQSDEAMRLFYPVCEKYACWNDTSATDINYSSAGWNGMLGENFAPAMEITAQIGAYHMDDSILTDPAQKEALATKMSEVFNDIARMPTGYDVDLFCGSGNSDWVDEENRGPNGQFICSQVRFVINSVIPDTTGESATNSGFLEEQELQRAINLYGEENARCWLAVQKTIETCKDTGGTCIFNLSGICGSSTP